MSQPATTPSSGGPPQDPPVPPSSSASEQVPQAFHATPNAERYVLQADALRRRQLRAAILYGSSRYWRRRQRVWPAAIAGMILSALIAGGIVVADAFQNQQIINEDRFPGRTPAGEEEEPAPEESEPAPMPALPPPDGGASAP